MRLNLERLEELKYELHGGVTNPNSEPLGLQIIMEALRTYIYDNDDNQRSVVINLLTDYGVLVNENETPIVKPHRFTNNG